eukprot:scaffold148_cov78-Phaeocystis_antarctica.AAC.13
MARSVAAACARSRGPASRPRPASNRSISTWWRTCRHAAAAPARCRRPHRRARRAAGDRWCGPLRAAYPCCGPSRRAEHFAVLATCPAPRHLIRSGSAEPRHCRPR